MTNADEKIKEVEKTVQSKIRGAKRAVGDAQGDLDRRDFMKSMAVIGGSAGVTAKYATINASAQEGHALSSNDIARANDQGVPEWDFYIDHDTTNITISWNDLFEREDLKLYFYLEANGVGQEELSADIGDDLSFDNNGDGDDLRSEDPNGVTFTAMSEDGDQEFTITDIFGDAVESYDRNGETHQGFPLTRHSEIDVEDFRVWEGNEPVVEDLYREIGGITVRVELERTETRETLATGESEPFKVQFGLDSGFGKHFGYNFGNKYPDGFEYENM